MKKTAIKEQLKQIRDKSFGDLNPIDNDFVKKVFGKYRTTTCDIEPDQIIKFTVNITDHEIGRKKKEKSYYIHFYDSTRSVMIRRISADSILGNTTSFCHKLSEMFRNEVNDQIQSIKHTKNPEYMLQDRILAHEWYTWHQKHAKLRLLSKTNNQKKGGKCIGDHETSHLCCSSCKNRICGLCQIEISLQSKKHNENKLCGNCFTAQYID